MKAAKLHFVDSGLACHLLGIRNADQLRTHPLRGAVFESWVAAEVLKARLHRGFAADLFHLRESRGVELDLIVERGEDVVGLEVKSGATVAGDFFSHLVTFAEELEAQDPRLGRTLRLVYGGELAHTRYGVEVLPWTDVQNVEWT